jgi:hypothetical protein
MVSRPPEWCLHAISAGGFSQIARGIAVCGSGVGACVTHMGPGSAGTPEELLDYEEISEAAIIRKIRSLMARSAQQTAADR